MTYAVTKSIDIDFAHFVHAHAGPCINIHGHTWKFELEVASPSTDASGFVLDFKVLKKRILEPVHALLDHSFAVGEEDMIGMRPALVTVGKVMLGTYQDETGQKHPQLVEPHPPRSAMVGQLRGAYNDWPGGLKVAVMPFAPTSELLAHWLWSVATDALEEMGAMADDVWCRRASIYETLHPVESIATYRYEDFVSP